MKYLYLPIITAIVLLFSNCTKDYNLDAEFKVPTELNSPKKVMLDVTSSSKIVLSWTGGGANDGSYVLYEVLFDKEGGDFSNPVRRMASDLGSEPKLTLSHDLLNSIARQIKIKPGDTGKISIS